MIMEKGSYFFEYTTWMDDHECFETKIGTSFSTKMRKRIEVIVNSNQ